MEKQTVTEEMNVHKEWKQQAETIKTPTELAEFIRHLSEDYIHDYGTIVHAMAAGMKAAFKVLNESDQGGITGFQASCLGWQMIREFFGNTGAPRRLVDMSHLLYPQYAFQFTSITPEIADWMKKEATKKLTEDGGSESVRAHWQKIADGEIPFGLTVQED